MKRVASLLFAVSLLLILFAACGMAAEAVDPSKVDPYDRVSLDPGGKFRIVVDRGGNVVQIPLAKDIKRVMNCWNSSNQAMFMLGAQEKLVGTAPNVSKSVWFNRLYPPIGQMYVAKGDGSFNIEEMMALEPDLVIVPSQADFDALKDSGFATVNLVYTNHEEMKQTVKLLGDILGEPYDKKAAEFIEYLDGNIERVSAVTSKIPEKERVRGYHVRGNLMTATGSNHLGDSWMNYAGVINSMHDAFEGVKEATMEQIIAADPDIIFVGNTTTEDIHNIIMTDPRWAGIKAVREGKVYRNPTGVYYWDRNSTETCLQILWAAKMSYPELFGDIDMDKEVRWFYKNFYNYEIDDEDLKGLLAGEGTPRPR